MTAPTVIAHGEETNLRNLVRDAHRLGIDVPKSVTDELDLHDRLTLQDPLGATRDLQAAHAELASAPAGKVDKALERLNQASLGVLAAQALAEPVRQVALTRLRNAVYDQLRGWETQTCDLFNATVDSYELNRWAPDLPDLATLVSPLDLSPQQNNALQHWRDAAGPLGAIWKVYTRIVQIDGDDVGPGGADDLSTNLGLACRLGHPGSFGRAHSAAEVFAGIATGSDAARRYAQLAPMCVPALVGYELRLSTSAGADAIRKAIQPAA